MQILRYLIDHHRELFEIAIAIHGVAMLICNLTPSPKDDETAGAAGTAMRQAYRALEMIAGIISPLAKR